MYPAACPILGLTAVLPGAARSRPVHRRRRTKTPEPDDEVPTSADTAADSERVIADRTAERARQANTSQRPSAATPPTPRPRPSGQDTTDDSAERAGAATVAPPAGTLVRYLTDPAVEEAIQAVVESAPPMSEVKRARLARLLGTDRCPYQPTESREDSPAG